MLPPPRLFPQLVCWIEQSVSPQWVSSANWSDREPCFGRSIFCQAGHCASWRCGGVVAPSDAGEEPGGRWGASRGISQLHQAACNFTLNFRTGAWIVRSGEWILFSYLLCNSCCTGFQSPETLNCNHQPALKLHKSLWRGFCLHMFCVIMS